MGNEAIPFADSIKILGFTMKRTGFGSHIAQRLAIARGRFTKLKRFKNLKSKTIAHLYKSLVRSALDYPNILLCLMSHTNLNKFQRFQNKVLRKYIKHEDDNSQLDIDQLHEKYKIEALNTRMMRRAMNTWEKLGNIEPELQDMAAQMNGDQTIHHYWWKRVGAYVDQEEL